MTGYFDKAYRDNQLARQRGLAELEGKRAILEQESREAMEQQARFVHSRFNFLPRTQTIITSEHITNPSTDMSLPPPQTIKLSERPISRPNQQSPGHSPDQKHCPNMAETIKVRLRGSNDLELINESRGHETRSETAELLQEQRVEEPCQKKIEAPTTVQQGTDISQQNVGSNKAECHTTIGGQSPPLSTNDTEIEALLAAVRNENTNLNISTPDKAMQGLVDRSAHQNLRESSSDEGKIHDSVRTGSSATYNSPTNAKPRELRDAPPLSLSRRSKKASKPKSQETIEVTTNTAQSGQPDVSQGADRRSLKQDIHECQGKDDNEKRPHEGQSVGEQEHSINQMEQGAAKHKVRKASPRSSQECPMILLLKHFQPRKTPPPPQTSVLPKRPLSSPTGPSNRPQKKYARRGPVSNALDSNQPLGKPVPTGPSGRSPSSHHGPSTFKSRPEDDDDRWNDNSFYYANNSPSRRSSSYERSYRGDDRDKPHDTDYHPPARGYRGRRARYRGDRPRGGLDHYGPGYDDFRNEDWYESYYG